MKIIHFLDRFLSYPDKLTRFQNLAQQELAKTTYKQATRKYLFIIADSGAGHRTTANAVKAAIEQLEPGACVFLMRAMDILNTPQRLFSVGIEEAYNQAIKSGAYWMEPMLFNSVYIMELPFFLDYISLRNAQVIKEFAPEAVVSFVPATQEITYLSLRFLGLEKTVPLYTVITDMVSMRDNWIIPEQAYSFITTQEAHDYFVEQGLPADKMKVTGLAVHPRFYQERTDVQVLRTEQGLDPERFTIMIIMGGNGSKSIYHYCKLIEKLNLPVQILACCGKSKSLFERLSIFAKISKTPIKVIGFSKEIPQLMQVSDLLITKPGSVTVAESISQSLPLFIDASAYIMWQEKGNAEYIEKHQIGMAFRSQAELAEKISLVVQEPERYAELKARIEAFPKNNAAAEIAGYLLQPETLP